MNILAYQAKCLCYHEHLGIKNPILCFQEHRVMYLHLRCVFFALSPSAWLPWQPSERTLAGAHERDTTMGRQTARSDGGCEPRHGFLAVETS